GLDDRALAALALPQCLFGTLPLGDVVEHRVEELGLAGRVADGGEGQVGEEAAARVAVDEPFEAELLALSRDQLANLVGQALGTGQAEDVRPADELATGVPGQLFGAAVEAQDLEIDVEACD